jgi:hypothetical protein
MPYRSKATSGEINFNRILASKRNVPNLLSNVTVCVSCALAWSKDATTMMLDVTRRLKDVIVEGRNMLSVRARKVLVESDGQHPTDDTGFYSLRHSSKQYTGCVHRQTLFTYKRSQMSVPLRGNE